MLVQHVEHPAVELDGLVAGRAERLLDDHPAALDVAGRQPVGAEVLDDRAEERGRRRQVERAVERSAELGVDRGQLGPERGVGRIVVERPGHVAHRVQQRVEHRGIGRAPRVAADRLADGVAVGVVGQLAARDADQAEPLGQAALVRQVVDRRQQLAPREVAGRPEDHQHRRWRRQAVEAGAERTVDRGIGGHRGRRLGRGRGVRGDRAPTPGASPRGRRTGCAARTAPWRRSRPARATRTGRTSRR